MPNQYFIIGGRYRDLEFQEILQGTGFVHGPFASYDEARALWRDYARASRGDAHSRCVIVQNACMPMAVAGAA